MMDLVGRSLVIVSKKRSRGGVKTCRIHDLLHDFCRIKAKEENFFQLLKGGYDEFLCFREPGDMRRLSVHSARKHFRNLRLFYPHIHSLLFFGRDEEGWLEHDISFIIPRYKRLRVLDVGGYCTGFGIPRKIGLFLQLKYLSVGGRISDVPSSICSLANLQTFILYSHTRVSLPDTFWSLQKLRHLATGLAFRFPIEDLESFPDLYELQSCSGASIGPGDSIERLIRKFPNIRKLRCTLEWEAHNEILTPDFLNRLESLSLSLSLEYYGRGYKFEFDFPENLRKLTLDHFRLHQSEISRIGKLPNLEVLKLIAVHFRMETWEKTWEETWDMVEGEFLKLRFLKLNYSDIVRWTASDDQFPCLEKLVLKSCKYLKELPCCFEDVGGLEIIEVSNCSDSVNSFFEGIQKEQMEMRNSLPKIHISNDD